MQQRISDGHVNKALNYLAIHTEKETDTNTQSTHLRAHLGKHGPLQHIATHCNTLQHTGALLASDHTHIQQERETETKTGTETEIETGTETETDVDIQLSRQRQTQIRRHIDAHTCMRTLNTNRVFISVPIADSLLHLVCVCVYVYVCVLWCACICTCLLVVNQRVPIATLICGCTYLVYVCMCACVLVRARVWVCWSVLHGRAH